MRYNLSQAEKAKVLTSDRWCKTKKASGSPPQEREISLEYVSGGEEEQVFAKATPSTHIRNLMRKETAQRRRHSATGIRIARDALVRRLARTRTATLN